MGVSSGTLGVFAKRPVAGTGKTRLAAETSPAWAAAVAAAFLADTLDQLASVDARRVLAFAPPDAESYFRDLVIGRFELTPQRDGDLGQRMAGFFAEQFTVGARRIVLVGSDSPTLPRAFVEQAFRELDAADVVLGPAADGGYYLIGCSGRMPPLFEGIAWGGAGVLHNTIARLPKKCRLALLPPWYDVDTLDDWQALCGHLAALRRAGLPVPVRTNTLATEEPLP